MSSRTPEKFVRDFLPAVVPGHRVVQTNDVARIGSPHAQPATQASVEVIREGDVIKAIDLTCSCGEKHRIWCSYEAKP